MVPMFAYFQPGQFTPVHTHPGPEAWWILEGEQCLQTTRTTLRLRAGHGGFVAEGDTMRLVATGKGPRRALALILHDPDKLPGSNLETPPVLKGCT
jgi:quercetin dioxygenase-like cupin family protein